MILNYERFQTLECRIYKDDALLFVGVSVVI
jgi:hypothetical protein